MLKTFAEKVDDATHAALHALGLSAETSPALTDALNDAITELARDHVTDDDED